jgi:hypothetical protein
MGIAITGKPFCADFETVRTQLLADGNRIQNTSQEHICRDSQGRMRTEMQPQTINAPRPEFQPPMFITIIDPVANEHYMLNTQQHTATKRPFRFSLPPTSSPTSAAPQLSPRPMPSRRPRDTSMESLGTQSIDGFVATGKRVTHTMPAGTVGNDQPLTTTSETWYSEDLAETILSKNSDPRTGETVREMKNVSRTEPDPSLFQVPADYKVEEFPPPTLRQ